MIKSDLIRAINYIENDKNIDRETLFLAVEDALTKAAYKTMGEDKELVARIDRESGDFTLYRRLKVVEEVAYEQFEINLKQARKRQTDIQPGDYIEEEIDTHHFGRIAAQTAKQVILQKLYEAERESIYLKYKERLKKNITGTIHRKERDAYIVRLDQQIEGILYRSDTIRNEHFRVGDVVRTNLAAIRNDKKDLRLILSRANSEFLCELMVLEVPEIREGTIEIINAVRDPGSRAKIAVHSKESRIDPVGACVGMRGVRIQSIRKELSGERIDIVEYSEKIKEFIKNAIAPADIIAVNELKEDSVYEVVTPDNQLSLAIGRSGQNVKLAARLVRKRLEVISESEKRKQEMKKFFTEKNEIKKLELIPGISERIAKSLVKAGFTSENLNAADKEALMTVRGISEKMAEKLIKHFSACKEDGNGKNTHL